LNGVASIVSDACGPVENSTEIDRGSGSHWSCRGTPTLHPYSPLPIAVFVAEIRAKNRADQSLDLSGNF
jgi:hypothetical protein